LLDQLRNRHEVLHFEDFGPANARAILDTFGANAHTIACALGVTSLGSPAGSVATTCIGSSASAAIAVTTSLASACCCDDGVTRTIRQSP